MRRVRYLIAAALVLGACGNGDDPQSDRHELESRLARQVEQQTGTRDVTVRCPEDGELCSVRAPGGVRARVTRAGKLVQP
jgi:hypothetical protein